MARRARSFSGPSTVSPSEKRPYGPVPSCWDSSVPQQVRPSRPVNSTTTDGLGPASALAGIAARGSRSSSAVRMEHHRFFIARTSLSFLLYQALKKLARPLLTNGPFSSILEILPHGWAEGGPPLRNEDTEWISATTSRPCWPGTASDSPNPWDKIFSLRAGCPGTLPRPPAPPPAAGCWRWAPASAPSPGSSPCGQSG